MQLREDKTGAGRQRLCAKGISLRASARRAAAPQSFGEDGGGEAEGEEDEGEGEGAAGGGAEGEGEGEEEPPERCEMCQGWAEDAPGRPADKPVVGPLTRWVDPEECAAHPQTLTQTHTLTL